MPTSAREESARLSDLLRREHNALADFLVALAAFDHERRWEELGYASLFDYLHRDLGLSKGSAFYRMTAARLVREHPSVVGPLKEGRLCLTSIVALAKVLTNDNEAEVLPRFFHLSKREAQAVSAELRPVECVPLRTVVTSVRRGAGPEVPAGSTALVLGGETKAAGPATVSARGTQAAAGADIGQLVQPANRTESEDVLATAPRSETEFRDQPMTADLSRVHITVPRRCLEKLEAARDALSHSHPGATEAEIFEVGLDLILERQAKRRGLKNLRKEAADRKPATAPTPTPTATPTAPAPAPAPATPTPTATSTATATATAPFTSTPAPPRARTRYIPADVRRAVWERDGGQCRHPLESGGVCGSTNQLEIHHMDPFALGGESTVEKLGIRCKPHNDFEARKVFGDDWMNQFTRRPPTAGEPIGAYGS